jgi:hypothetical protein
MYIPPMPVDVQELHDRIVNTIALKGSDDGVLHLEKSCFWTLYPSSSVSKNTFRKLKRFPSSGKMMGAHTLLGPF